MPLIVVELEPGSDSFSSMTGRVVFVEIDLFAFETSPEAFGEDAIRSSSFSIHTNLNTAGFKTVQIAVAGEMAPLVAVPDLRNVRVECPIDTVEDKGHLQGVVNLPGDDIPRIPVDDHHKIEPPAKLPDVCDIDAPNVLRVLGCDSTEQIRIDLMSQGPLAEIGAGVDFLDPHLAHCHLDTIPAQRSPSCRRVAAIFRLP